MPRRKNPEDRTGREEIAAVIAWARQTGYADVPAIRALSQQPTASAVRRAIQWADGQGFINVAAALRERALDLDVVSERAK